jgi:hypothetical protein
MMHDEEDENESPGFPGSSVVGSEMKAALASGVSLEDKAESGWESAAQQFVDDYSESESEETGGTVKVFRLQRPLLLNLLLLVMIELPAHAHKKEAVMKIMELRSNPHVGSIPRRRKGGNKDTPEVIKLIEDNLTWISVADICQTYLSRILKKITKIVKENQEQNMSQEDRDKLEATKGFCRSAGKLYTVIKFHPQPTAIHWTPVQAKRLNLNPSDLCGISGYLSASDLVGIFQKAGVLSELTYFCDIGAGFAHVVLLIALFGVAASIGFEVHVPTVAASISIYEKIMKNKNLAQLLKAQVIIHLLLQTLNYNPTKKI